MPESFPVLVVDDDDRMRELLVEIFSGQGHKVLAASDGDAAIRLIIEKKISLIVTDLKMPKQDGMAIVRQAKAVDADLPIIMITGHGSVNSAIEAMKQGAYDYIEKPFDPEQLKLVANRALRYYQLIRKNRLMNSTLHDLRSHELIGGGPAMQKVKQLVAKIAPLDVSVMIQGETGTGKELVARLVHRNSRRAGNLFLPINCGAIAESLLESELFGHEQGAFTGAEHQKKGLVELASSGTLFLDELNSMPAAFQSKILRFLQDRSFFRVGGGKELHSDVRIVAATNVNLVEEVAAGRFRDDLYFRLSVMVLRLPPLRERPEDIPELACYFLRKYSSLYEKKVDRIEPHTLDKLIDHPWPGNIRELENVISSSVIMTTGTVITSASLPDDFHKESLVTPTTDSMKLSDMEQSMMRKALLKSDGNKARAARMLGIDTSTLWRKMKRYGL
ncbi:MAG: sigma-54 dependent transcriptional regulator [Desulfobacteraceae bacterium]|nr:sigma-54 dependent transcriptional regulator [Desulfobacteraceae bacterium]